MNASRIPDFDNKSHEGMSIWFAEMALRGLLFHPEDAPRDIIKGGTPERLFTPDECVKLDGVMAEMFTLFSDGVCEICYPIFVKTAGRTLPPDDRYC